MMHQLKHFIKKDKTSKAKKLSEMTEEERNQEMRDYFNGGWISYIGGRAK